MDQSLPDTDGTDILRFLDHASQTSCFDHYWKQLQTSTTRVDLDALRVCIKLLPSRDQQQTLQHQVQDIILKAILLEARNATSLAGLANLCHDNSDLGQCVFQEVVRYLRSVAGSRHDEPDPTAIVYLDFLKRSFWLLEDRDHYLTDELVQTLCDLLGLDHVDEPAHDALSALLSLLLNRKDKLLIKDQLWSRFQQLDRHYFQSKASKAFRTWFQWTEVARQNGTDIEGLYDPLYWDYLRLGLLSGFADQRKYCLGILQQSLVVAKKGIDTPTLALRIVKKSEYIRQYQKYQSLFQIIVLDRYPNQVQACLPELTNLFGSGSLITSRWVTALLSSALDSNVQDGVRKLIGTWYMDYITKEDNSKTEDPILDEHVDFVVEGFLPWATQGTLFTSSLVPTRHRTVCNHGEALSTVISTLFLFVSTEGRRDLLTSVLRFVLERGGRIFPYAIVYLMQGVLEGWRNQTIVVNLEQADFALVTGISRLSGLPEIASDLLIAYCTKFCQTFSENVGMNDIPGYDFLNSRYEALPITGTASQEHLLLNQIEQININFDTATLQEFLLRTQESKHLNIRDTKFAPACNEIIRILDSGPVQSSQYTDLYQILEAFWEEADRQEYRRPVALKLPSLFFHPAYVQACVQTSASAAINEDPLNDLMIIVFRRLSELADGRVYVLSALTASLRKACFAQPGILEILPFDDFFCHFIEKPPELKNEFIFEVAAAEKLEMQFEGRNYEWYYGKREWHAYASVIDLLNRFPDEHIGVAKNLLQRLLEPWRTQKKPVPIISKWKNTFQLQAMLVLVESCVSESDAAWYLQEFMKALVLEQWPRYRFLLEWIIARIYYRYPDLANRILPDLAKLDDAVPVHIASLMKLAVLSAPFLDSEEFALRFMTQLIPFSASPKVHIRHEAHWSFPIIYELAEQKRWPSIIHNPAFSALNTHIRNLDKFKAPASTIRTLRVDVVKDFTLVGIFQGAYLTIENPVPEVVSYDDFIELWKSDERDAFDNLHARIPLGQPVSKLPDDILAQQLRPNTKASIKPEVTPTTYQTKAGSDLASRLPSDDSPPSLQKRPASVILIASLIDNPTNLGGLSRISESFGLEALHISSLSHLSSKDFQATAVTSHKHLPIHETKIEDVPRSLIDFKQKGYEVVAVEQTDRSGILGQEPVVQESNVGEGKAKELEIIGTLPRKCVLVLGSEKGGVTSEVLAVVDRCVEIKTTGVTRSLNVQTAAGIAVYEWWREWGGK